MPKHRPTKKARTSSTSTKAKKSSVLPTDHDPEDTSFCMTLYSQEDEGNVNTVHNKIRKEVIQIKRTESGRVYFQCGSCSHLPRSDRVKISTIAPTSVACIYRAFGRFIKHHVPDCPHIPKRLKVLDPKKVTGVRGSKNYWISSANAIGLYDGDDGESILYCHPAEMASIKTKKKATVSTASVKTATKKKPPTTTSTIEISLKEPPKAAKVTPPKEEKSAPPTQGSQSVTLTSEHQNLQQKIHETLQSQLQVLEEQLQAAAIRDNQTNINPAMIKAQAQLMVQAASAAQAIVESTKHREQGMIAMDANQIATLSQLQAEVIINANPQTTLLIGSSEGYGIPAQQQIHIQQQALVHAHTQAQVSAGIYKGTYNPQSTATPSSTKTVSTNDDMDKKLPAK